MKNERIKVKRKLFLKCGRIDMYDMQEYCMKDLTLHHLVKYCETKHTIFEESALLSAENHKWLHSFEETDPYMYYLYNEMVWSNKHLLMEKRKS